MNLNLVNNKNEDQTPEEFVKMWENAGYTLRALARTIVQFKKGLDTVKPVDFDTPNHYAKLMYQQGKLQALNEVLALLPESAKD